ncbi:MAG TPA: hypothetical protein VGC66_18480 [Pyrinomonadaceae bacterium]
MLGILVLIVASLFSAGTTHAQQTVFNVPTTDVLPAGKAYVELDISAKPNNPKFSTFVPRIVSALDWSNGE